MRHIAIALVIVVLANIGSPVEAGKLGQCKRCVNDNGIEAHLWTRDHLHNLGFCQSLGMNDGGDGDPALCDYQAGVSRWTETNDPFSRCATNASNHSAWIGGEKDDLIVLSPEQDNLNADGAEDFRVQDGDGYRCRLDFASGQNFTALKFGERRDLINIYTHAGSGVFVEKVQDRLQNGKYHAMEVGENFVAVLFGNHKDIIKLYGVKDDGEIVITQKFVNDGRDHTLTKLSSTDVGLIYGRNDDIRMRYCFTGEKWRIGYRGIKQPFAQACDQDLTWETYTREVFQRNLAERSADQ